MGCQSPDKTAPSRQPRADGFCIHADIRDGTAAL